MFPSLRSWRDFARECFCFGGEAVNASGEAVRGLVKSRVELVIKHGTVDCSIIRETKAILAYVVN